MVLKAFHSDALDRLCTKDQLDLLNSIDSLRSQGISHYVSLPQIIVCGDQSSGKSSVLEAISGVSFPVKSNLCTRFPTELVLRKTSQVGVSVSISPHQSRSEAEQISLSSFHEELDGFDGLPALIEKAKVAMGIMTHGKAFSEDILRVEVSGPDRPHLTIVDLPGLVHSSTKHQSDSDIELVKHVVKSYMKKQRSIILAVISAKNDIANQIVLKLARAADKQGHRTLGVITKPDLLNEGSDNEAMYVSLAKNQEVEFRLGWHVLKNMDSEKGEWSLPERHAKEKEFFSEGVWKELPHSLVGIDTLRDRLSKLLLRQIAAELPSLIVEIDDKVKACRIKLDLLGDPRATVAEQRLYLLHISQSFQTLVKAAVDGTYNDPFFGDAKTDAGYQKRIRAVTQNLNLDFAEHIETRGHHHEIVVSRKESDLPKDVIPITRDKFLTHIQELMRRTRGRELPGTFNPMIIADLFLEQSLRWENIARDHVIDLWNAAKDFLHLTVNHVADAATSKALFQKIFEPALTQLKKILDGKTAELLVPHQKSHPITYNHYFIETLQKLRNERRKKDYEKILTSFFKISSIEESSPFGYHQTLDLRPLLDSLMSYNEPDMNRLASSEALDCMLAYYKVALKRFIDDVAIEVIEAKLLSPLGAIFSPVTVCDLSADLVTAIAGESKESRELREQLGKQLDVLMKGSETCKRFVGARLLDGADETIKPNDMGSSSGDDDNSTASTMASGDEDDGEKSGHESPTSSERNLTHEPEPTEDPIAVEIGVLDPPAPEAEDTPVDSSWGWSSKPVSSKAKKGKKKSRVAEKSDDIGILIVA